MPCICAVCNRKVPRESGQKIECQVCKQFRHWECAGISNAAEFDLLNVDYKCVRCLRRHSPSPAQNSPLIVASKCVAGVIDAGNNVVENTATIGSVIEQNVGPIENVLENSLAADLPTGTNNNFAMECELPGTLSTAVVVEQHENVSAVSLRSGTNANSLIDGEVKKSLLGPHSDHKNVSLEMIFEEMLFLKKQLHSFVEENAKLYYKVDSLENRVQSISDENVKLHKKMDSLYLLVRALKSPSIDAGSIVTSANVLPTTFPIVDLTQTDNASGFVNCATDMRASGVDCSSMQINKEKLPSNLGGCLYSAVAAGGGVRAANIDAVAGAAIAASSSSMPLIDTKAAVNNNVNNLHFNTDNNIALENAASLNSNENNNNNWTLVNRKKFKNTVIGTGANNELDVVKGFKWLHVSSFKNTVTEQDIINYLVKHTKISDTHFRCFRLVKKGVDIDKVKFVNFKLGVTSCFYNEVTNPDLWPTSIRLRRFVFVDKNRDKSVDPSPASFLVNSEQIPLMP